VWNERTSTAHWKYPTRSSRAAKTTQRKSIEMTERKVTPNDDDEDNNGVIAKVARHECVAVFKEILCMDEWRFAQPLG